jgi:hypothetical protein
MNKELTVVNNKWSNKSHLVSNQFSHFCIESTSIADGHFYAINDLSKFIHISLCSLY